MTMKEPQRSRCFLLVNLTSFSNHDGLFLSAPATTTAPKGVAGTRHVGGGGAPAASLYAQKILRTILQILSGKKEFIAHSCGNLGTVRWKFQTKIETSSWFIAGRETHLFRSKWSGERARLIDR